MEEFGKLFWSFLAADRFNDEMPTMAMRKIRLVPIEIKQNKRSVDFFLICSDKKH